MSATTLASTAERLLDKYGRSFILRQSRPVGPVDTSKPWLGYEKGRDESGVTIYLDRLDGGSLRVGEQYADGDIVKSEDRYGLIAGNDAPSGGIRAGDTLTDANDIVWRVKQAHPTQHGDTTVLWEVWVRR